MTLVVPEFTNLKVLVAGDAMLDEYFELRELWNDQRQERVTSALDRVG